MKVVIIGAGVAGLGIGWKLAQAGAGVTVLERAEAGSGATTASAGMIAAAAELGGADTPAAAFAKRANELWPAFVKEVEAQSGVFVDYKQSGSLLVALKPTDLMTNPHAHGGDHAGSAGQPPHPHAHGGDHASSAGHPPHPHVHGDVAMLEGGQARAMEPMLVEGIAGALWAPKEAQIDSHALSRALATAFVRAGGKILTGEAAVRIETEGGRVTGVRTPVTVHRADAYVLAAGAWCSRVEGLPPEAVPPVVPIKGEIVVLAPPPGAALPTHVVWGNEIYVVPRGNRLLVGATTEPAGFDTGPTQAASNWLRRQSTGLMPALSAWEMVEHWASLRPASPDGSPILGPTMVEGLYVASGQYRNGILFAPAVADVLCRLVLERAKGEPAFDPLRFKGSQACAPGLIIETKHRESAGNPGL